MSKFIKIVFSTLTIAIVAFAAWSFKGTAPKTNHNTLTEKNILGDSLFNAYWYDDKAEIRTYNLSQSRYGEMHQGTATVIFVAQPFSKKKGVKPDSPKNSKDHVQVLKMNLLKKFGTGISVSYTHLTLPTICSV